MEFAMKNSMIVRLIKFQSRLAGFVSPRLAGRVLERRFLTPRRLKLRKEERAVMDRAGALPLRLDCERTFPVFHWGRTDAPVIALVHGWSGRAGQLSAFVDPLLARGFRVVAMEAPGHGAADGRFSSIVDFMAAIAVIDRQFGPLHGVIAHSMGGAASLLAAARGLAVARIAVIGTPANPAGYLPHIGRALGFSREAVAAARVRVERRFGEPMDGLDPVVAGRGIASDVLVIHDRHDRQVGFDSARRLAGSMPGAQLMETKGLGHARILKDQCVIDAVTLFLASTGPRTDKVRETADGAAA